MKNGWAKVPLGDVLKRSEAIAEIDPTGRYRQVTVRLWGQGVVQRDEVDGSQIVSGRRFLVHAGQFILSRIDARNGAFGLVPEELDGAVVSNDFPVFDTDGRRMLPEYLGWLSRTRDFVELCKAASEGTTNRVRLKEGRFLSFDIPLPPLDEQRRIVAKLDQLAAKIDEAISLRSTCDAMTEQLTDASLRHTVADIQKRERNLPISDLIVTAGYGTSVKCDKVMVEAATPVLRIPNVASGQITMTDIKYAVLNEKELTKASLIPGDILLVRTNGSADLVGRSSVVPELSTETAFASYLIRLRPDRNKLIPHFLQWMLRFLRIDGQLFDLARTTAGQYNVSLGRLRPARIPVPSLREQEEIVVQLQRVEEHVNRKRFHDNHQSTVLNALLPSILDKAFRGDL